LCGESTFLRTVGGDGQAEKWLTVSLLGQRMEGSRQGRFQLVIQGRAIRPLLLANNEATRVKNYLRHNCLAETRLRCRSRRGHVLAGRAGILLSWLPLTSRRSSRNDLYIHYLGSHWGCQQPEIATVRSCVIFQLQFLSVVGPPQYHEDSRCLPPRLIRIYFWSFSFLEVLGFTSRVTQRKQHLACGAAEGRNLPSKACASVHGYYQTEHPTVLLACFHGQNSHSSCFVSSTAHLAKLIYLSFVRSGNRTKGA
jgi:hypothetical protein